MRITVSKSELTFANIGLYSVFVKFLTKAKSQTACCDKDKTYVSTVIKLNKDACYYSDDTYHL